LRCSRASQRLDGRVVAISTKFELDTDKLEARDGLPVPTAVVRNVHCSAVSVELAINRGRVRLKRYLGRCGSLRTRIVVHAACWVLREPVADFEHFVGKVARFPDGEARWVAIPAVVGLSDIAHIVHLFARVVIVNILSVARELVAAIFYAPEPILVMSLQSHHTFFCKHSHVVAIEADTDLVTLAITSIVATTDVVISSTRDTRQIKNLDDGTPRLWI
jgi:hypothetical protein